jgi:putative transcriptional regulator
LDRADTFLCELGVNMPKNRIRELRVKKGMSQKQLAEAAETSQQQIQRIEAGSQNARLEVAALICRALGAAMPEVFPTTELPLSRLAKRGRKLTDAYHDDAAVEELENAGIDMDIVVRTFVYRLRGGAEGSLPISGSEYRRLWSLVQDVNPLGFAVFDSGSHRYAINLDHLLFCHFLFDAPFVADGVASGDKESDYKVKFYLLDSPKPHVFGVYPDSHSLDDEEVERWQDVQLQDLFFYAESGPQQRFKFTDEDGETAFFRPADVVMFSVPLRSVEPALFTEEEE